MQKTAEGIELPATLITIEDFRDADIADLIGVELQRIVSVLSAVGGELKNARIVQRTEVSIIRD